MSCAGELEKKLQGMSLQMFVVNSLAWVRGKSVLFQPYIHIL